MLSILNVGNEITQIYSHSFYFLRQNTLKGGVEKQEKSEDDERLVGGGGKAPFAPADDPRGFAGAQHCERKQHEKHAGTGKTDNKQRRR
jgi:hypothetical protein